MQEKSPALKYGFKVAIMSASESRERVLGMRRVFRRNRKSLGAVAITAIKE